MDDRDDLQRLVDEAAIRRVVGLYARGVDRMDWELIRSCYHIGAIDQHGWFDGPADDYVAWLHDKLRACDFTLHHVGQQLIEFEGDDVAWSEASCVALHRLPARDGELPYDRTVLVRFCDRFERRNGDWRIAHRVVTYGPARNDPVVDAEPDYLPAIVRWTRDPSDAAYWRSDEFSARKG